MVTAAELTIFRLLPFAAAACCVLLATARLFRTRRSIAGWCFVAGMGILAADSAATGLILGVVDADQLVTWLTLSLVAKSLVPITWLPFSLTYSRSNAREFLAKWRLPLAILSLLPILLTIVFRDQLFLLVRPEAASEGLLLQFGPAGKVLNVLLLIGSVLILMNMEQTFRSAVGTMRWQIKFVVLGMVMIFGASIYVRSQAVLFSAPDLGLLNVEVGALLIGCVFLALAYARSGLAEIDVYPSLTVVRSSLTIMTVGGYLLATGVLAQVVLRFGGAELFQFQALVVLVGLAGLTALLASDRARRSMHAFAVRHFSKAQHDSVRVWTTFSRRLAGVNDQAGLCESASKLISETFDSLSVTIWLLDIESRCLKVAASTSHQTLTDVVVPDAKSAPILSGLQAKTAPFDLEAVNESWAEDLRQLNATAFATGGHRLCVPLRAGDQTLGAVILGDRVGGAIYTGEELELLRCIGDQMTSVLLNLRLSSEVTRAKEFEAVRTMSAFFVHDLKNTAASLNLMLKNLPVHFDDPAFRQDALRAVGNTAGRIDEMIVRLTAFRERPKFSPVEADLNQLVSEALDKVSALPDVELTKELQPLPKILADGEQIQSVVTNLVLNAKDALTTGGRIHLRTEHRLGRVVLSVADNGCGMSPAFVRDSLFRPFQSTKKKGLGIGLFQSRAIVQAHGGGIDVKSEAGKGTTFLVSLPVKDDA